MAFEPVRIRVKPMPPRAGRPLPMRVVLRFPVEAQLYEATRGRVFRVQQWWSWREALDAVGIAELPPPVFPASSATR